MGILRIFLDNPGGLRYDEFMRVVKERKICARGTANKIRKEFMNAGLIKYTTLGRYTLGFSELLSQSITKGCYMLPGQVQSFLDVLYKEFEETDKGQAGLFSQVAVSYIGIRISQMNQNVWYLFPLLYDKRVREVWFFGQKYALDFFCEKMNEISQRFIGEKLSDLLLNKFVQNEYLKPQLESLTSTIIQEFKKIDELIDQLNVKDATKRDIKSQLKI
jgi:hypothetical protein